MRRSTGPLQRGDHVPWFHQRSTNAAEFFSANLAGRVTVVCAFGSVAHGAGARVVDRLLRTGLFDDVDATLMGISVDPDDERLGRVRQVLPGFRCFWDVDHRASRAFRTSGGPGTPYEPRTIVLDRRLRVVANLPLAGVDADAHADEVRRVLAGLARPDTSPAPVEAHAPVLVVPDVFEPELCEDLIDHYRSQGAEPTGTMSSVNGRTVHQLDLSVKRRSDCLVPDGHALKAPVLARIERRLLPSIAAAFQFRVTRVERHLVACYTAADAGFFMAHRDNTTPGTAHRRFAVSIGLNEDYDGGELVFGEFGPQRFKVPAAGAIVFGCSLLHEVVPVTRGRRYAFLPFLFDEAGERIRQANLHLVDHD